MIILDTAILDPSPVSRYLSDLWDGGDPWGSAMSEGFAICDFLTFELGCGSHIPAALGYSPAMGGADEESAMWEYVRDGYMDGHFTTDDLIAYLTPLNEYLDACKAEGRDY